MLRASLDDPARCAVIFERHHLTIWRFLARLGGRALADDLAGVVFVAAARAFMLENAEHGWASSPVTQNGCVRILSQPAYASAVSTAVALEKLAKACATSHHEFWPDAVSLLDPAVARQERIHGQRQLTDQYLLALAVHRGGRFVTHDGRLATSAIVGASAKHLVVI